MKSLDIRNLRVRVEGKDILNEVNLTVKTGQVAALMGPNGSGKSTLAAVLLGHPRYEVISGSLEFDGQNLLNLKPHERAKLGLFLSFQYPVEVPGVSLQQFLRLAFESVHGKGQMPPILEFRQKLSGTLKSLGMPESFAKRAVNEGFSGGEKKRAEIVQMALLRPAIAILDETDSGLDVDALKIVAAGVNALRGPDFGCLLITHYSRILTHVVPDVVHVMVDGKIIRSGGPALAHEIEANGYEGRVITVGDDVWKK